MKKIVIFSIVFYQKILSPAIKNMFGVNQVCRFSPSCSEYAKNMVVKYGLVKGGGLAVLRLLNCRP